MHPLVFLPPGSFSQYSPHLIRDTTAKETRLALSQTGTDIKRTVRPTAAAYISLAEKTSRGGQMD